MYLLYLFNRKLFIDIFQVKFLLAGNVWSLKIRVRKVV